MNKTVSIELKPERLENRHCSRCGGNEFYALDGKPRSQMAACSLDCGPSTGGCGHLLRIDFKGNEMRCGDQREIPELWDDDAPAAIPLAMCYTCGKLVTLV